MNVIHLVWWDSDPTVNWKIVDDEINPPFYFHCSKIVWGNTFLFQNIPNVVFLFVHFNRCWATVWNTKTVTRNVSSSKAQSVIDYEKTGSKMRTPG